MTAPEQVRRYTYQVVWSPADDSYVATVTEFPSLSWIDTNQIAALRGLVGQVSEILRDLEVTGEPIPDPRPDNID